MNKIGVLLSSFLVAGLSLSQAQDKTIMNMYRVLPNPGKDTELKKALTAHAAKYHKGDLKWRVLQVVSGPDEGAYQINEGPTTWAALEARKNISDEHDQDYLTNVLPLVDKSLPASYMRYEGALSTDSVGGKFKKVFVRHFFMKPGKGPEFRKSIATWKKVSEKAGDKVVVWWAVGSGQPQYIVAHRMSGGWADLDKLHESDSPKSYDEVYGSGAYDKQLDVISQCVDRIVDEMLEFLPEVSSPELTSK